MIHSHSGGNSGALALLLLTTAAAGGGPRASQERSLVAAFSRRRHKPQSSLDKQRLFSWPSLPFLAASALPVLASPSHSCRLCAQPRGNIIRRPTNFRKITSYQQQPCCGRSQLAVCRLWGRQSPELCLTMGPEGLSSGCRSQRPRSQFFTPSATMRQLAAFRGDTTTLPYNSRGKRGSQ